MSITVDTVQLKFNVKPSYEQQQIQKLSADLKQATANYAALGKAAKDNAKEHSKLFGELARLKNKREELSKQKSLTGEQQQELARYNQKIEELTDSLTRNEEQRAKLSEVEAAARKDMVDLQNKMNGVNQSTLKYNMTIQQLGERERELRTLLNNIDPNTEEWEKYNKELSDTKKRIADLRRQTPDFHNELRLEDMTIKQLNERIGALRTALESCKPNTPEFKDYSIALEETQNQLKKVEGEIGNTKNSLLNFHKGINFDQLKTMISANFLTMIGGKILDTVSEYAGRALNRVKELVAGSVEAARSAQGITHAFEKMNNPDLLKNLRQATHGTVSDLELMKAAVRAQDFRLPLDQLGKYLEFAQLKAQQTGQSVDYMTDSIVTGLGRKSKPILDNLGISASEIDEEMKKTGDMAVAVGNIIDRQLTQAGEHFETAAERETRATTDVTNAQLKLGQQMQKTFGIGNTSLKEMQAKAETFVLNGLTKLIVYCQDLYNKLGSVRLIVEGVKVTFDTLFKVCELGFKFIIDTVKGVGRVLRDLAGAIEGIFTFNPDKVLTSLKNLGKDSIKTFKEFIADGKNVGERWGKNVLDSINAVMGKSKVNTPDMQPSSPIGISKPDKPNDPDGVPSPKKASPNQEEDDYQKRLSEREQAYQKYNNSLRQMLLDQLLTEGEFQEESMLAEKKFLADKISLMQQYGKDYTQEQGQFLDLLIREANNKYKQSQQQLKDSLAQEDAQHSAQLSDLLKKRLNGELDTEKQYNELKLQADIDYQKRRLEILKAAGADTTQVEQQLLQLQLQQHQQAEQNKTSIEQEETEKRNQIKQAAMDAANQLLQSGQQLFSLLQSREIAAVEKRYKTQINAARKAGKDTTKLEEQMEAEKSAIQKKYAQKQFKLQVLQIIAATAQSIANVWKEWAWQPAVAAALSAVAAAQGAIQLATAKAQADQAAGLYEGGYSEGYTAKGDPHKQAGVIPVHQNEFVANHHAVANPEIRPLLDVIDRHQKIGDIRMLNSTRMLEEAYGGGRARGGYTNSDDPLDNPGVAFRREDDEVMQLLRAIESNTADSLTVRELRKKIKQEERLEQNASR